MSDASPLIQRLMMEIALLAKLGQAYEDFFSDFGGILWGADFEPWKPQGRLGDFKCDGYLISEKAVFQCYAPERLEAPKTEAKIRDSFAGALDHFGERMEKWCFVHNRREGLHATSNTLLGDLRERHPGITIEPWGPQEILRRSRENPVVLEHLFPEVLRGSNLDSTTEEAVLAHAEEIVRRRNESDSEGGPSNQPDLAAILDELSGDDREIRRHVMGLAKWLDPAPIRQITDDLLENGFAEATIKANVDRLCEAEIVIATRSHLLPLHQSACQEAADSMTAEMIGRLG